jgi:hypothetical protein
VGGACGTHGRGEESVQSFGGKARIKETAWKLEDGIRFDFKEVGWGGGVQSGSSWLRIGANGGLL